MDDLEVNRYALLMDFETAAVGQRELVVEQQQLAVEQLLVVSLDLDEPLNAD